MSTITITKNMNLIVPTPGINGDPGPDYANNQNQDLVIIDGHNHGPGSGVLINPTGLDISTNLNFQNNSPYNVASVIFSVPASNANLTTLYTAPQAGGGVTDLFYNDGVGNVIALTRGGLVNATIASIPGESYSGGTFTWKQGAGSTTPANFDIGSVTIRPNTAGTTNGVILGPPSGISSLFNVQLPIVPGATSFLQIDSSGNMSASIPVSSGLSSSNFTAATVNSLYQPGDIITSGSKTRTGCLACDGTSYLITDWPALAAALFDSSTGNYAYGSLDSTHFCVPDLRGQFLRMVDGGAGNDPDSSSRTVLNPGGNTGDNIGSLQAFQIQAHSHQVNIVAGSSGPFGGEILATTVTGSNITANAGGNQTNPVNVYVNYFIKT